MSEDRTPDEERLRELLGTGAEAARPGDGVSTVRAVRRRVRRRRTTRGVGVLALAAAGGVLVVSVGAPAARPAPTAATPYRLTGALTSFDGCTDYLAYVKRQALAEVGPYGLGGGVTTLQSLDSASVQSAASTGAEFTAPGSTGAAAAHSTTTDQVAGVDEPDTVKTDGRVVVTLTGSTLRVLGTDAGQLGSLALDGDTSGGLLLVGDRAVVLSGQGRSGSAVYDGLFGARGPAATPAATGGRATVVDLSDPRAPRLVRTFTVDGTVIGARLVDGQVRVVLRTDGARLAFQTPTGTGPADADAATAANRTLIDGSTLADWLPAWQAVAPDGSTSPRRPLAACDAVARPTRAAGTSTVSVFDLDPTSPAPGAATSLVAAGDTVYATADRLVVAGLDPAPDKATAATRTRLYEFATVGAGAPRLVGAGSVPGTLLGSYALDVDAAGLLRVAYTAGDGAKADTRVAVLRVDGQALRTVGQVGGLGRGQQVRAVRFEGDLAYVVTFRSVDPLYVLDLRDPAHPRVTGSLEQPGYSAFLVPLSPDRLLGVGVVLHSDEPAGVVLTTYDVADPAHPRQLSQVPVLDGYYRQDIDPHAFLSWPPARLVVLATPSDSGAAAPATAVRVGPDGVLTRAATLTHGGITTTRTLVVGDRLWGLTGGGVVTAELGALGNQDWHPFD